MKKVSVVVPCYNQADFLGEAGAYFHLSEIEKQSGRKQEAKNYLRKCLKLDKAHVKAKEYLTKLQKLEFEMLDTIRESNNKDLKRN